VLWSSSLLEPCIVLARGDESDSTLCDGERRAAPSPPRMALVPVVPPDHELLAVLRAAISPEPFEEPRSKLLATLAPPGRLIDTGGEAVRGESNETSLAGLDSSG